MAGDAVRVADLLPKLAAELAAALEHEGHPHLADQVPQLRIVDRCRCGDDFCGTFYAVPPPRRGWGPGHDTLTFGRTDLIVDIVNGRIVCVEVLYRDEVRDALARAFP